MKRRHLKLKKMKNQGKFRTMQGPTAVDKRWKQKNKKIKLAERITGQDHGCVSSRGWTTAHLHAVVRPVHFLWFGYPRPCAFRWWSKLCNSTIGCYNSPWGHIAREDRLIFSLVLGFIVLQCSFLLGFCEEHQRTKNHLLSIVEIILCEGFGDFFILGFMHSQLNW